MRRMPWEGEARCGSTETRTGRPCSQREIAGLGACIRHVPDDLLEEAEQVTGWRRCRQRFGQPDACRKIAVAGTDANGADNARCKNHGANLGSNLRRAATGAVIQLRADTRAAEIAILPESVRALLDPEPIANPLEALLEAAAVAREWERVTRRVLAQLQQNHMRYERARLGEQVRGEILIHQQALNTLLSVLEKICRLNLDAKLAGIREQTARHVEAQIDAAFASAGASAEVRTRAREAFRRGLRVVA